MKHTIVTALLPIAAALLCSACTTVGSKLVEAPPGPNIGRPIKGRSFGECSLSCEATFNRGLIASEELIHDPNHPNRPPSLADLQRSQNATAQAVRDLYSCLEICIKTSDRNTIPYFLAIPDPKNPGRYKLVRFTLDGYWELMVERYLGNDYFKNH